MNKITVKLSSFEWAYGIGIFFIVVFSILALVSFPLFMGMRNLTPFFIAQFMWVAFAATPIMIYFLFVKNIGTSKKNHIEISTEGVNLLGSNVVIGWNEISKIGVQGMATFHQGWEQSPYLSFELKDKTKLTQIKSLTSFILTHEVMNTSFFGPDKFDIAINMSTVRGLPNQDTFEKFIEDCGQKLEFLQPLIQTDTQEKYEMLKVEFFSDNLKDS